MSAKFSSPTAITTTATPDATIVTVTGELDLSVNQRLGQVLAAALVASPPALIVDLSAVDFCSVGTLRLLLDTTTAARRADIRCVLVSNQHAVSRPIALIGIESALAPLPSVQAAWAALGMDPAGPAAAPEHGNPPPCPGSGSDLS